MPDTLWSNMVLLLDSEKDKKEGTAPGGVICAFFSDVLNREGTTTSVLCSFNCSFEFPGSLFIFCYLTDWRIDSPPLFSLLIYSLSPLPFAGSRFEGEADAVNRGGDESAAQDGGHSFLYGQNLLPHRGVPFPVQWEVGFLFRSKTPLSN